MRHVLLAVAVAFSAMGCAKKKMSDRETTREQARIDAEAKRQELSPAAGVYRGTLTYGQLAQDVTLTLDLKDMPDPDTGQIDPVLVPVLAGSLRLTFGSTDTGEHISWSIAKADFSAASDKIDLVLVNETFKELLVTLNRSGDALAGTWNATTLSSSGDIALTRADPLQLQSTTTELRGLYEGYLSWASAPIAQAMTVNITTQQNQPDRFTVSGTLKMLPSDPGSNEVLSYPLDKVELNPLTRQVTLAGEASDVACSGLLLEGRFAGSCQSKRYGAIGTATLQRGTAAARPEGETLEAFGGAYYGTFTASRPDVRLPPRVLLSIVTVTEPEAPGALGVSGNLRFYFGAFGTTEFVELPFTHTDYAFFHRNLDAKAEGRMKVTIDADIIQGKIVARVFDEALGAIGTIEATRAIPDAQPDTTSGEYKGYLAWNAIEGYQRATVNLTPTFSDSGMTLSATLKLHFGEPAVGETLTYRLPDVTFDPVTGAIQLRTAEAGEVVLKGTLQNGVLQGDWTTARGGAMGAAVLQKGTDPAAPAGALLGSLRGSYRGALRSLNPQVSLPERIMIGLVTAPAVDDPRGLRVTGHLRLYLGGFDTTEYNEYAFEQPEFDFFTRKLTARTAGDLAVTVKADLTANGLVGQLFHDSLGLVGAFEVQKHD